MKLGRYDLTETYGAKWVEWADGLKPRLLLMECAIKLNQWVPAVDHIDRAVEFTRGEPLRGELFLKKAYILVNLGRLREADDLLEKAKERLPGHETRLAIERQLGFNAALSTNPAAAVVHFKTYRRMRLLGSRSRPRRRAFTASTWRRNSIRPSRWRAITC